MKEVATRYRKVEVAVWGDARWRRLTPLQPCGQALWLWMLTSEKTISIPGVVVGSDLELAGSLRWPLGDFQRAFAELERENMVIADWDAGLVLLERALVDGLGAPRETAAPQSPNVIKSWAKVWEELPDSPLKATLLRRLMLFCDGLGRAFRQAFREGFAKAIAKAMPETAPIQDQDQDQEQEQEQDPRSRARGSRSKGSEIPIPDDWRPNEKHAATARELGVDLEREAAGFRDHAETVGRKAVSWDAAFRTWLRKAVEFGRVVRTPQPSKPAESKPRSEPNLTFRYPGEGIYRADRERKAATPAPSDPPLQVVKP